MGKHFLFATIVAAITANVYAIEECSKQIGVKLEDISNLDYN